MSGWLRSTSSGAACGWECHREPSANKMGSIRSLYFGCTSPVRILVPMSTDRERVISVTLSEAEWQAFVARHPQPVTWLRERIREEVQVPVQKAQKAQNAQSAA